MFDYEFFLQEFKDNNKERVEKYQSIYGDFKGKIKEEIWFKEYVSQITPYTNYKFPMEHQDDFDWGLLSQLVVASISSDAFLQFNTITPQPELCIYVQAGEEDTLRTISELWSFQILRLFEIYCSEWINFSSNKNKSDFQKVVLENLETNRDRWENNLIKIDSLQQLHEIYS